MTEKSRKVVSWSNLTLGDSVPVLGSVSTGETTPCVEANRGRGSRGMIVTSVGGDK